MGLSESIFGAPDFIEASGGELLEVLPRLLVPKAESSWVRSTRVAVVGGSIGGLAAAACLRAAGFEDVQVFERSSGAQAGAGVGLDDVSMAILKGLGVQMRAERQGLEGSMVVQRMRWTEEVTTSGRVLMRQANPYFAALYAELAKGLLQVLPEGSRQQGHKAQSLQRLADGSLRLCFAEGASIECDVCICADGPRSSFRSLVAPEAALRFAGYAAWRGTIRQNELPVAVWGALLDAYPRIGNCLYFIHCEAPRQHCVLYDLGDGLLNWLIYENRPSPVSEAGRTTSAPSKEDVTRLQQQARRHWGEALGAVIEATADPFWTDIYDIQQPLESLCAENVVLLGDSAHPITPHSAKGSNLALHDAFVLASEAAKAASPQAMLQAYSKSRAPEAARTVLLSRHLGQLRNGLIDAGEDGWAAAVKASGLETRTLPVGDAFQVVWDFVAKHLKNQELRGLTLAVREVAKPLYISAVNHISRETCDVERLSSFYEEILGLQRIKRPDFPFGGAWFQLPGRMSLHIIERDPEKPEELHDKLGMVPERYIRRSHHVALTVEDIEATKKYLASKDIPFAVNAVPGTPIVQLFLYDPDGNGIEIGNFDIGGY